MDYSKITPTAMARLLAVATTLIEEGIISVDADCNLTSDALSATYQAHVTKAWERLRGYKQGVLETDPKHAPIIVEGWSWWDIHSIVRGVVGAEEITTTDAGLNKITNAVFDMVSADGEEGFVTERETIIWYISDYLREQQGK